MNLLYKTYSIDYDFKFSNSSKTLLFLHGWGGNKNSFNLLIPLLSQKYNIITLSFPPYFLSDKNFDKSILSLDIYDYKNIVLTILDLHNIKNVYIICHSFGFRVALTLFSEKISVEKLIVTGGAGIKFMPNIFKQISLNSKTLFYKQNPNCKIKSDYSILNNVDKKTFKNIVDKNLYSYAHLIKCKTLLFWGKYDKDTPLKILKFLKKLLHCKTIVINSEHFAYLNFSNRFKNECIKFLNE